MILDRAPNDSLVATAAFAYYANLGESIFNDTLIKGLTLLEPVVTEPRKEDNDVT